MPEPIVTSKAVALLLKKGEAYVRDGSVIQGPWKELQTADSDVDPIEPTGQAAELMRKRMIKEAFREPNLKLDDLLKERCIVMWRIIRKMGEYFGYPSANTSIAALDYPVCPRSPRMNCGRSCMKNSTRISLRVRSGKTVCRWTH